MECHLVLTVNTRGIEVTGWRGVIWESNTFKSLFVLSYMKRLREGLMSAASVSQALLLSSVTQERQKVNLSKKYYIICNCLWLFPSIAAIANSNPLGFK